MDIIDSYMRTPTQAGQKLQPGFFSTQVSRARRFFLDMKPASSAPLRVVCGGCEHCASDYHIVRKGFSFYCIEFVVHGKGTLVLNGHEYPLQPGAVFSYGPGMSHNIACDPSTPLVKYFVDFVGTAARRMLTRWELAPGSIKQITNIAPVTENFDALITTGASVSQHVDRLCSLLLECLMIRCADNQSAYGEPDARARATYQRCVNYLADHIEEIHSVEQAAKACHIDQAYLCRLFRRFGQYSPYQQILRLRMRSAAQKLMEPGRLVKEVASEMGFEDPYHFSRVFKKVYEIPPERFIQLSRR